VAVRVVQKWEKKAKRKKGEKLVKLAVVRWYQAGRQHVSCRMPQVSCSVVVSWRWEGKQSDW
jgi:hypothetical protein